MGKHLNIHLTKLKNNLTLKALANDPQLLKSKLRLLPVASRSSPKVPKGSAMPKSLSGNANSSQLILPQKVLCCLRSPQKNLNKPDA